MLIWKLKSCILILQLMQRLYECAPPLGVATVPSLMLVEHGLASSWSWYFFTWGTDSMTDQETAVCVCVCVCVFVLAVDSIEGDNIWYFPHFQGQIQTNKHRSQ